MGLQKNVANQKWLVFAFDRANNAAPKTGDAAQITAKVRKDYGSATGLTDVNPAEIEDGYYEFDLDQAESNADVLDLLPESSTANITVIAIPARIFTVSAGFFLAQRRMKLGTVDTPTTFTATTTQFEADDITEATADHFNGRIIVFTSGALIDQATTIEDYVLQNSKGFFTVTALTEAPANGDTFIIV